MVGLGVAEVMEEEAEEEEDSAVAVEVGVKVGEARL